MKSLTTVLCLLLSVAFIGCNKSTQASQSTGSEDAPDLSTPTPLASPLDEEVESHPNPLVDQPDEPQGLKSSKSRQPRVYLNLYYGRDPLSVSEKAKFEAWLNKRGITSSEGNVKNFHYSQARLLDLYRDRVTKNLVYDGNDKAYVPTLVMTDEYGRDLRHNIGVLNLSDLDFFYDVYTRQPSKEKLSRGMMSLPPEENPPIKYEMEPPKEDAAYWDCGPKGCKPKKWKR